MPGQVRLEQSIEFINTEIGLMQDGAQGATIKFFMVRDYQLSKRLIAAQDNMAAVLTFLVKTNFNQGFHTVSA